MEDARITTFWPMGQKIVEPKTGRVVQLPKVFRDEKELREFLDEVLERALQKETYASKFRGNDIVKLEVSLNDIGIHKEGIDSVKFIFQLDRKSQEYKLISTHPVEGSKVFAYKPWKGVIEPVR
ncbi:hypothetical protein E3E30_06850 [Thermococcus sp. 9N3]|nr:hypothetical protein [Thermococcus sp. 9N3]